MTPVFAFGLLRRWTRFGLIRLTILIEPRDVWIGVYWTVKQGEVEKTETGYSIKLTMTDVYVCVVPCVPLLISIATHPKKQSM